MKEIARVGLELLIIGGIGCAVGLGANSARGKHRIEIGRNYFPAVVTTPTQSVPAPVDDRSPSPPGGEKTFEQLASELETQGLQAIRHEEVAALFKDELYSRAYIFFDARDDEHYIQGHIPNAYHLYQLWNTSEIERVIGELQGVLQPAAKIVVYCNGGDCTDSAATARILIERGVDRSKVFVDVLGFKKWKEMKLPVEAGQHGSGDISGGAQ